MDANALLSLLLPDGILKRFEFVKCDQEDTGRKDLLSDDNVIQINIYLDERDNRTEEEKKALRGCKDSCGLTPSLVNIRCKPVAEEYGHFSHGRAPGC